MPEPEPGLHQALLERERKHQGREPRDLLDTLEAGEPAVVSWERLCGWEIPKVPLTAEQKQWGHWFTVSADDTIVPEGVPRPMTIRKSTGTYSPRKQPTC